MKFSTTLKLETNSPRAGLSRALENILSDSDLGFHSLPISNKHWDEAFNHAKYLKNKNFQKYIIIGIGGSTSGGQALCHAFSPFHEELEFWDSIDPQFLQEKTKSIDWSKTHFISISKSGSTLESLELINHCISQLKERKIGLADRFTVITENKSSPLTDIAKQISASKLEHPLDVGGRFSALTVVGLLPLALVSKDLKDPLSKAKAILSKKEPILDFCESILTSWKEEKWITVFWSYDEKLRYFGPWIQQIWAESLAQSKRKDGSENNSRVSTPYPVLGSQAQHSVLQQFAEGYSDKLIVLLDSLSSNESLNYKMNEALALSFDNEIPYIRIKEWEIVELLFFFELVIACLGDFLEINPFIQPGVEKSKSIVKGLL